MQPKNESPPRKSKRKPGRTHRVIKETENTDTVHSSTASPAKNQDTLPMSNNIPALAAQDGGSHDAMGSMMWRLLAQMLPQQNERNSASADIFSLLQNMYKQHSQNAGYQPKPPSEKEGTGPIDNMAAFISQAEQHGFLDKDNGQKLKFLLNPLVCGDGIKPPITPGGENQTPGGSAQNSPNTQATSALQSALMAKIGSMGQQHRDDMHPLPEHNKGLTFLETFSDDAVRCLISIYKRQREGFVGHAKDRMRAWEKVCNQMREHGYVLTRQQCKNKWHSLVYNYRQCNEYNKQIGYKRKECPYYKEVEEVLEIEQRMNRGRRVAPVFYPRPEITTPGTFQPQGSQSFGQNTAAVPQSPMESPMLPPTPKSQAQEIPPLPDIPQVPSPVVKGEPTSQGYQDKSMNEFIITRNDQSQNGKDEDSKLEKEENGCDDSISRDITSMLAQETRHLNGSEPVDGDDMSTGSNNDTRGEPAKKKRKVAGKEANQQTSMNGNVPDTLIRYILFNEKRHEQELAAIKEKMTQQETARDERHKEHMQIMTELVGAVNALASQRSTEREAPNAT